MKSKSLFFLENRRGDGWIEQYNFFDVYSRVVLEIETDYTMHAFISFKGVSPLQFYLVVKTINVLPLPISVMYWNRFAEA